MKVVARLPPSGLGSAALPAALADRWAVGGGLWERGISSVRRGAQAGRATGAGPHTRGDCGNGGDCGNRRVAAPSPAQKDVSLSAAHFRRGTRPERMRGRSAQGTLQESGDPSPAGRGAGGPLASAELAEAFAKGLEGPGRWTGTATERVPCPVTG